MEALLKETGHTLTLDDFPYLLKLHTLACAIGASIDGDDEMPLVWPTLVSDVLLHPLTLGRIQWFEERGMPWFGHKPVMADLTIAFLMTRNMPLKKLWAIQTKRECAKAVKKWWRNVDCSYSDLRDALLKIADDHDHLDGLLDRVCGNCLDWSEDNGCENEQACGQIGGPQFFPKKMFGCYFHKAKEDDGKAYYGPVIALLCREYGSTPDYWLWEAPLTIVDQLIHEFQLKVQAEEDAVKRAGKGTGKAPAPTITARRVRDLRLFKNKLRELWLTKR